jgi:hypothetical protein
MDLIKVKKLKKIVFCNKNINIKKVANIKIKNDCMVTFINNDKKEYDFCKKKWGYYATPSINHRLTDNNFRTVIIKNILNKHFICVVEKDKIKEFSDYLKKDKQKVIMWLNNKNLKKIENI